MRLFGWKMKPGVSGGLSRLTTTWLACSTFDLGSLLAWFKSFSFCHRASCRQQGLYRCPRAWFSRSPTVTKYDFSGVSDFEALTIFVPFLQRMREIQDYFQLRLSSLRQKQSQQRETFLILETQQRPQQQLQHFQLARGENGSVVPQQSQDKLLRLGLSGQYGLGNSSWGTNAEFGNSGGEGRQPYGSI